MDRCHPLFRHSDTQYPVFLGFFCWTLKERERFNATNASGARPRRDSMPGQSTDKGRVSHGGEFGEFPLNNRGFFLRNSGFQRGEA